MPTQSYDLVVRSCCRTNTSAYRLQEGRLILLSYGAFRCSREHVWSLSSEVRTWGPRAEIILKIYTNTCFIFDKKQCKELHDKKRDPFFTVPDVLTLLLKDFRGFCFVATMDQCNQTFFGGPFPARGPVQLPSLPSPLHRP